MPFIIAEPCVGTCDTACVEVCPVDCIHGPDDTEGRGAEEMVDGCDAEGKELAIDPMEWKDCEDRETECQVEKILEEDMLQDRRGTNTEKNAKLHREK